MWVKFAGRFLLCTCQYCALQKNTILSYIQTLQRNKCATFTFSVWGPLFALYSSFCMHVHTIWPSMLHVFFFSIRFGLNLLVQYNQQLMHIRLFTLPDPHLMVFFSSHVVIAWWTSHFCINESIRPKSYDKHETLSIGIYRQNEITRTCGRCGIVHVGSFQIMWYWSLFWTRT